MLRFKPFSFMFGMACLLPWFTSSSVHAAVGIHGPFGSHMVLQREKPVPVWGSATPGEEVTVEFAGQKKSVKADEKGKWKITLDPLAGSKKPQTMIVKGATGAPIQFDDVLVGEVWLGLGASNMMFNYEHQAEDSKGRGEKDDVLAAIVAADHPLVRFRKGKGWAPATSDQNKDFSALMLSFGVVLQKELDVPVGLIAAGMGSTVNGASKQAFEADPAYREAVARARERIDEAKLKADHDQALKAWEEACRKARAEGKPEPGKPREPRRPGEGQFGGFQMESTIRGILWDQGEGGTGIESIDQPTALGALIRYWRKEWAQGDFPFLYIQKPVGGGCAWDPKDPVTRLASPFAPLPKTMPTNALGTYNKDREEYHRVRENPGFFMVTSSDLGGYTHPTCKSGYGARAARVALGGVYGRKVEIYGPVYRSHAVEAGGKVRIQFTHVGQGLAFRHGDKLQGFAIAGADKQFQWADAAIDGDTVVVSSPKVAAPEAVRYAWAGYPAWANLFNKDGLPALSFRTDNWVAGDRAAPKVIPPMYVPVKWEEKEARKLQSDWAAKLKVEVETKTPTGIVMVLIPPAGPAIPKPYWLGKYELTQAEWEGVMGYNPSGFKKGNKEVQGLDTSRFPVERVSWYDCLEFCNKLSEKEGLPPYYALKVVKRSAESGIQQAEVKLLGGNGYHLPTEIQWEHGCRAGTTTGFCFGDNEEGLIEYGWFDKNSGMRPHPVGEKKPNAFGLHDMHGNVREWVVETISRDDFSALSSDRAVIPGRGMNRGGAFEYKASVCRSYESRRHGPADRLSFAGFRLARFP